MESFLNLLASKISIYGLLGVTGFLFGGLYIFIICKIKKKSFSDMVYCYVWGGIFCMIGAKLFYLIQNGYAIVTNIPKDPALWMYYFSSVMSGGFVFYGGLFGALAGCALAAKFFKYDVSKTLSLLIPSMAIAHGFARLGCHTVGCCHGIEFHSPISVVYEHSEVAPNGVPLFPVQLSESIAEFIIFVILFIMVYRSDDKKLSDGHIVAVYLLIYAIVRFGLEFLRGDAERGVYGVFSTSQWVSLILPVIVVIFYIRKKIHVKNA